VCFLIRYTPSRRRAEEPVVDNGQLPIDPLRVKRLSELERAIWSEKMKCGSNLEVALKLFLYEDVVERYLETIERKLGDDPAT
jgi:hypothetical protein